MLSQNIFILNSKTLYDILIELKNLLNFSILHMNEKDLNKRPEIQNLIGIYSSLKSQKITDTINEFQGKNFSNFKEKLSEVVIENISPISKEIKRLTNLDFPNSDLKINDFGEISLNN